MTSPQRKPTRQVALYLDARVKERLEAHCKVTGERQNVFIRRAIVALLDAKPPEPAPPG